MEFKPPLFRAREYNFDYVKQIPVQHLQSQRIALVISVVRCFGCLEPGDGLGPRREAFFGLLDQ